MQLDPVCGNTQRLRQRSLEQSSMSEDADPSDGDLCSVDFEIFGYVQERKGLDLGLVGWVKNTSKGTVMGQVQGPQHLVNEIFLQDDTLLWEPDVPSHHILEFEMSFIHQAPEEQRKLWLSKEGSPFCRISRAVFKNEKKIPKLELSGFSTRF
ncbi:acylphosphatase 2, muscle type isoform X2 [Brachyhypopomus gauderio]|uniref:acylphosphatase 2, muscle type isoform X2 n=1 Tax=Brachyhypopomus gauderio TaxID=698409 RepID=UPI0040424BEC